MRLFTILIFSFVFSAAASAAPVKLTDAQMDAISAGLAVVVVANAGATGDIAIALTDTNTKLLSRGKIGVAIGRGLAVAVGSESAATGVDLFGEGDVVRTRTRSVTFVTKDGLIVSKTIGFVFAIELPDKQVRNVRSRWKGHHRGHREHGHRFGGRRAT